MDVHRGDIVEIDFGTWINGSIQGYKRPAVVISNNKNNKYSTVLTVVPLSTKYKKKRYLPTHVFVSKTQCEGLEQNSVALAEQITTINKERICNNLGSVNEIVLMKITKAVQIQVGVFETFN